MTAESEIAGDLRGVDRVQLNALICDFTLCICRNMLLKLCHIPRTIDKERAARLDFRCDVVLLDVCRVVAGYEVCGFYVIRRTDRSVAKTEMALRDAERFLCIIFEISLCEFVCMRIDDLDRILVGADGTVRAETPEFAADKSVFLEIQDFLFLQRQVCHIVIDADRKTVDRLFLKQVRKDRCDLGRRGVLGGQTVTAADHNEVAASAKRCTDILIQRLAGASHLFCAIQNSNRLACSRYRSNETADIERPIQMDLYKTDFLAASVQEVDRLLDASGNGSHRDNDTLCIRRSVIIEDVVLSACNLADLSEISFYDIRQC